MSQAVSRPSVTAEALVHSQTDVGYLEIAVENVVLREVFSLALRFSLVSIIDQRSRHHLSITDTI